MDNNNGSPNLDNMLKLAQFGADRHNEKRQVVFRVFISYMTLLVIISTVVMKHWKDEILTLGWFAFSVSIFLFFILIIYWRWLITVYKALIYDVRRRDFFLKKAEVLCYHLSKDLANDFSPDEEGLLNLASGISYEINECSLFEKSKPDIETHIRQSKKVLTEPCKPKVCTDTHFWFNLCSPTGLTFLIILALVGKSANWF